jgi:hypothetical protein
MAKNDDRLADSLIIDALLCGATAEAAATKAGVSARTVRRRLRNPAFVRKLRKRRAEADLRAADQLAATRNVAIRELFQLLQSSQPPNIRLGAIRIAMDSSFKLREHADYGIRLAELEQRIDEQKGRKR